MKFKQSKKINDVWYIYNFSISDYRGSLTKVFDEDLFKKLKKNFNFEWKQVLISSSKKIHTIRGLFYQSHILPEGKLIYCLKGSVFWVSLDLRLDSKTFGKWVSATLTENDKKGFLIPSGFANGCLTLKKDTDILLLGNNNHLHKGGYNIDWRDKDINIKWPKSKKYIFQNYQTTSFKEIKQILWKK